MGPSRLMRPDSFLQEEDFNIDQKYFEKKFSETEHECDICGERFLFEDEIVFLQMVQSQFVEEEGPEFYPVLTDDGDYLFSPLRIHIDCWQTMYGELKEFLEGVPPHPDAHVHRFCLCAICGSNIREWERFGLVEYGELHRSDRCPDGRARSRFVPWDVASVSRLCTACQVSLNEIGEGSSGVWEHAGQENECSSCTHDRCWRDGDCPCSCHSEGDEE